MTRTGLSFVKNPLNLQDMLFVIWDAILTESRLSNSRILSFDGQSVSFAWRDYKDGNKSKVMTLDVAEFSRRFLLHVLPNRFVKIRHYGLLCSRNTKSKLSKCMKMTGKKPVQLNIKEKNLKTCRCCGSTDVTTILVSNSLATASSA